MRPLLSYSEVIANNYISANAGVVISPETQSLVIAALNILNNGFVWADYDASQDDIEAALADAQYEIMTTEIPPPVSTNPTIDLFCANGAPLAGAGSLTYTAGSSLPFGYYMLTANTTLFGIENDVWLRAGEYSYVGWASLSATGGNTEVAITDGASVIDTIISAVSQNGAANSRVKHTGSFTIPEDDFYKVVAANNGTGSGSNRQMNWTSHHIRRTGD